MADKQLPADLESNDQKPKHARTSIGKPVMNSHEVLQVDKVLDLLARADDEQYAERLLKPAGGEVFICPALEGEKGRILLSIM